MAEIKKNSRIVQLLVELLKKPKKSFSVTELMRAINLDEKERRNVQRDINTLVEMPDNIVICEGRGPHKKYQTGLNVLDKLTLPNFEESMLQFVFLQGIMDIYPGTADLIDELLEKIQRNLPFVQRDKLKAVYREISSKVYFMGSFSKVDETAGEKLHTVLQTIRSRREIQTLYTNLDGEIKTSYRIPLGIVLYQNEIYVACVRHQDSRAVYAVKLSRIRELFPTNIRFCEKPESRKILEKKIDDCSLFEGSGDVEQVRLTFPSFARQILEERPYHPSMKIVERKGVLHVTMKVNIGFQLKQWLLFHTPNSVTVVKPKWLRDEMLNLGNKLVSLYSK